MEEVTEVAEVGILVVVMARSVVREVGGAMSVGFMVLEPMIMDEISVDSVREDFLQGSIGLVCVVCRCTSILGNSNVTAELIANVSAFYKAARSNHPSSVDV